MDTLKLHIIIDMSEGQAQFSPHFGIAYLSSYLKAKLPHLRMSISYLSDPNMVGDIEAIRPHIIGITSTSRRFHKMRRIAEALKTHFGLPMLWGGVHISIAPHELPDCIEVGVLGEGEETLLELLTCFDGDGFRNKESIRGIAYRKNGQVTVNEKRPVVPDLDTIPFPDIDLLRVDWSRQQRAVIISSRGCPFKCRFCASSVFWDKARLHSAEYVIDELRMLVARYGVKEVLIYDDFFTIDKRRIAKIAQAISESEELRGIRFECLSRLDGFDEQLASDLRKMGMYKVSFGFESGCQTTLDYLKNGKLKLQQSRKAVSIAKMHGLQCVGSFVIGSPYENEPEVRETFRFIEELGLDNVQITVATPFPGTAMWEDGKKIGVIRGDQWRDEYYAMFAFAELQQDNLTIRDFLSQKTLLTPIEKSRFIDLVEQAQNIQERVNGKHELLNLNHQVSRCINLAVKLAHTGNKEDAFSIVSLLLQIIKDSSDIYCFQANLAFALGHTALAREVYSEVMRRWPSNQQAYVGQGMIEWNLGNASETLSILTRSYAMNPFDKPTVLNLSNVLRAMNMPDTERKVVNSYLSRYPSDKDILALAASM
ncbi:MAG: radical SAM protein [Syntrophobacteraceae bacterium]